MQERMRLHSLIPLASREDVEDKKRRVPNGVPYLVREKMVDVIAAEKQRKEDYSVKFRGIPAPMTPLSADDL